MALKDDFIELQYQEIKKMFPDREIYLVRDTLSGQLLLRKKLNNTNVWIYKKLIDIQSVHLPKIFDIIEKENSCFVYEEFIQGKTLDELLKQGNLSKEQAIEYISQLCSVLQIVHGFDIIHRDIQPKNIIISNDGVLKLIDFGNARIYDACKNRDTVLMGTAGYASPEQFGTLQTDKTTDIYALGVLLNKMLTGHFPNEELYEESRMIKKIILKCTEIDRSRRYQSVSELKEDLQKGEKGYFLKSFIREIPGFRPGDKHPWVIRLLVYPFFCSYCIEISNGIKSVKPLNCFANIIWYLFAMLFSSVLPFILISNMWELDTRLLHLNKYSKRKRLAIRIGLAYLSGTMLGVMLAVHYAL